MIPDIAQKEIDQAHEILRTMVAACPHGSPVRSIFLASIMLTARGACAVGIGLEVVQQGVAAAYADAERTLRDLQS